MRLLRSHLIKSSSFAVAAAASRSITWATFMRLLLINKVYNRKRLLEGGGNTRVESECFARLNPAYRRVRSCSNESYSIHQQISPSNSYLRLHDMVPLWIISSRRIAIPLPRNLVTNGASRCGKEALSISTSCALRSLILIEAKVLMKNPHSHGGMEKKLKHPASSSSANKNKAHFP